MKKLISLLIIVHISICLHAVEFTYNGLNYSIISEEDKTCEVARNSNISGDLVIPPLAEYNGTHYSVISIGNHAFFSCSSLTSIDIPNSVITISFSAFYNCKSLTSIEIPNSVTSIGESAFSGCSSLTSVDIPNSVTSIGDGVFSSCSSLMKINVSSENPTFSSMDGNLYNKAKTELLIVPGAYRGNFSIPNSVTSIGYMAFSYCEALTSVEIPNSVTSIGILAFNNCYSMLSVDIPSSVTSIGKGAFMDCLSLSEINVSSDNAVFSSMDGVLYNKAKTELLIVPCSSKGDFSIPNSVNLIIDYALYGCYSLKSVDIPNSVTSIGESAFEGCLAMTSVVIPNSVTSIGGRAFYVCSSLNSINIPNSVTSIGQEAFAYCSSLTSVVIPNSVTSIGNRTFSGCSALTSVCLPKSVTSIGERAFSSCSSLTSVDIPYSVTSIGKSAFSGCSSLTSVNIPNSVISIGEGAFSYCSSLTSVVIPNSVTSIESHTFTHCSSLTSIDIPNSVTSIENNVFWGCTSLLSVELPNSLISIGELAFSECSSLASVVIPNSVTSIGPGAFNECSALASVDIPNSVTSIGQAAFAYCSSLTSVDIPNSVTSIGLAAFYGCTKLSEVYCYIVEPFAIWLTTFDDETYHGTLHVPVGKKEAYEAAEGWREFANIVDDLVDGEEEGPAISHSEIVIAADEVFQLGVNDWEGDVSWSSSDPSVAYVNECGLVVAMKSNGTTTITASAGDTQLMCDVTVVASSDNFFGDDNKPTEPEKIKIESLCTNPPMLNVRLEPVGACTTIGWTSSDESIATVDRGFVSAYAVGTVVLCTETGNGLQAFITISTDDLPLGVGDIPADGGAPGSNDVYDITGRCILPHATREQINALRPGIYFLNGKKVRL